MNKSKFTTDELSRDRDYKRIKVCIISIAFWPFLPGQGTRMSKVDADLLKEDFELTVITSHTIDAKSNLLSVEYDKTGTKIVRIPYISFRSRSFTSRSLIEFISFFMACLVAHKHIKRDSILFTCGPPEVPYLIITTSILKFFNSVKHLGLATDILPDVAFNIIIKFEINIFMTIPLVIFTLNESSLRSHKS